MIVLLVLAGGLGAAARFAVDGAVRARRAGDLPWGTLVVNVTGSFLLGLLTGLVLAGAGDAWRLVLGTGFCGGFTTFSTAAVDTVHLARRGALRAAAANLGGNLVLTLLAAALGLRLAALL
ncbi:fluoride efflux transporter CrcB [Kineococcus sp. SYSU DK006]|uniref:fluoride efflux transporter CrcB n=1 Tax=Kineococcus sp. SYSU DK006 TaxID=3383127 RepID=UPI003D7CE4D2